MTVEIRFVGVEDESKQGELAGLVLGGSAFDGFESPITRGGAIQSALSTGSLPIAFGVAAHKIAALAYQQAPAAWRSFAAVKSTTDFKANTAIRPNFFDDLKQLPGGGQVEHADFSESTYVWQADTYARQLQIDRRDIINDDASILTDVIPSFGRGAARALNALVTRTILANTGSFWATANSNYFEGAATNLQSSSLATAIRLLRQMKNAQGGHLDLEPRVLLVPPELEQTARELLESAEVARSVASTDRVPIGNVFKNVAMLAVEPRLSDSGYTGNSATAWYLFSAPENASVVVGFLEGKQEPTIETFDRSSDINHLTFGWRCYHDFGCALGDPKTSIKSKGAA